MRTDCEPQLRPKYYRYGNAVVCVLGEQVENVGAVESFFFPTGRLVGGNRALARLPKRLRGRLPEAMRTQLAASQ